MSEVLDVRRTFRARAPVASALVTDPLLHLVRLTGVRDAAEAARDALATVHRHPANRRGWPATATEASVRGARASAAIEGASTRLPADGRVTDPVLAGALRVGQALDGDGLANLVRTWSRAPLQVLARLHLLAGRTSWPTRRRWVDRVPTLASAWTCWLR